MGADEAGRVGEYSNMSEQQGDSRSRREARSAVAPRATPVGVGRKKGVKRLRVTR